MSSSGQEFVFTLKLNQAKIILIYCFCVLKLINAQLDRVWIKIIHLVYTPEVKITLHSYLVEPSNVYQLLNHFNNFFMFKENVLWFNHISHSLVDLVISKLLFLIKITQITNIIEWCSVYNKIIW